MTTPRLELASIQLHIATATTVEESASNSYTWKPQINKHIQLNIYYLQRPFIPVSKYVKVIKIHQEFPKL